MRPTLLSLVLCAACTPADDNAQTPAVGASARDYATQLTAPAPDYAALLAEPRFEVEQPDRTQDVASPPANAKAIGDVWIHRLEQRNALLGYGLSGKDQSSPVDMIDVGMTADDFAAWATGNGWDIPAHIRWGFVAPMTLPPVSGAAREGIRVWPAATARTGMQHQALHGGRVYLRDGCFYTTPNGQGEHLAFFHAEMHLDVDEEGFYYLRDRVGGQYLGRLGEKMHWSGPASAVQDADVVERLREACGDGEIFVVGSPESAERFYTQYPHTRGPQLNPPPPSAN